MNTRKILCFLAIGLVASLAQPAQATEGPGFPRLAGLLIGSPQNYEDAVYQAQIAKLDLVLLNTWKGWQGYSGSSTSLNAVVRSLKTVNPAIKVFQYTILEQVGEGQSSNAAFADQYKKVSAMNWWVYNSGTSGSRAQSSWQGSNGPFYEINLTMTAPVDSSGNRWTDWFANWAVATYVNPNPSLDGLYADSVSWFPNVAGAADWNRDGTADLTKAAATTQLYRQGYQHYFKRLFALAPGKLQIANVANWGDPSSTITEYNGMLNGGVIEGLFGETWSIEASGGWAAAMKWYRKTMAVMAAPKLVFFAQNATSTTDYQSMRYGLTSCLMDDGYFAISPNDDFHTILWYDEFDSNLGQATTSPPTVAWQNGVYRRDFENGIALVNPKGNGVRTIALGGSFKMIAGKQAPATNTGATVTSVTLNDRDGIILLRLQPLKRPSPVPSVQVQ